MNIQRSVLIETLKSPSSDLCWCSCNILSTHDHNVDVVTHDESAAVFSCKVESFKENWECILNALLQPEDDGKGHISDLIVYDRGEMTLLIHEGKKADDFYLKDGSIPDPISIENVELNIFQIIIKHQL